MVDHWKKRGGCEDDCRRLCCIKIEDFGVTVHNTSILRDVNLHIHCGELTALIGPNGAGKSTLLKAILGELAHSGSLHYLDAKGVRTGNPLIGYVPQSLDVDEGAPVSVEDFFVSALTRAPLWLGSSRKVRQRIYENLSRVEAEHLMGQRLGALSGGEMQRVMLAMALDPLPDLLLLDEPVSGIDQNGLEMFYRTVSSLRENYDMSIILVSHDLTTIAKYADRVILLNQTVVCNGTAKEVFCDSRMRKIFGWMPLIDQAAYQQEEGNQ